MCGNGSAELGEHDLTYTPNGQRATDTTRLMNADNNNAYLDFVRNYTYDPQERIALVEKKTLADVLLETETYTHDPAGNLTEQTMDDANTADDVNLKYTYDRNRLLKAEATPLGGGTPTIYNYNYDPTGRLDNVIAGGTLTESYEYDGFDHTSKYTKNPGSGAVTTSYTYDPLDRTSSRTKNAGTPSAKTTDFAYLGLTDTLVGETDDANGQPTKSYQYTPWGERLSQVKHNSDGTTEDSFYGYNPHTDVETLTRADGTTRATYGYTAYGKSDNQATTGVDKLDLNDPTKEPYNPYRYTGKRWDSVSGNLDMGFRDYSPGLNRFLTLDSYNGALNDLSLSTSPWTSNRYALAGGNPVTGVELDGHIVEAGSSDPSAEDQRNRDASIRHTLNRQGLDGDSWRPPAPYSHEVREPPAAVKAAIGIGVSFTPVGVFGGLWEGTYDAVNNVKEGDYRAAAMDAAFSLPFTRLLRRVPTTKGLKYADEGADAAKTETVWDDISGTADAIPGTGGLPKSFELTAGDSRVWVHGNSVGARQRDRSLG